MIDNTDIVLFLGAGFALDAGLPLMPRFGFEASIDRFKLVSHANAPKRSTHFRNAAPMLVEAGQTYDDFRNLCASSGLLSQERWDNLETVMSVAEAMDEAGKTIIDFGGTQLSVSQLRSRLKLWTWKVYHQLPVVRRNPPEYANMHSYDRLFDFVGSQELANRLTVITTNYDIAYEYLAWRHKLPCRYPFDWDPAKFSAGHGRKPWIYGLSQKAGGTVVCKLHGSINYFIRGDKSSGTCNVASDLGDRRQIGKSGIWRDKAAILAVDAIWNIRQKYGQDLLPAIVPPTYAKLHRKRWLVSTIHHAFAAVRRARVIIFVGYSFPPSDGFIESLLVGSISIGGLGSHPAIYVVDPSPAVHSRYRSIFGPLVHGFDPMGFGDATRGYLQRAITRYI